MNKQVLLVEPEYYTQFPPLGLLKLATYHRKCGDEVQLVHGINTPVERKPDLIYVTSLFTWSYKPVWESVQYYTDLFPDADLWLGGLYASLMPQHAALSGAKHVFTHIFEEAEDLRPDYSLIPYTLVPEWNVKERASIVFASRGCIRSCPFCAVPKVEGALKQEKRTIKHLIWPGHSRVIFFDNNFLASQEWSNILDEVKELNLGADFNQGLDARRITNKVAKKLAEIKIDPYIRLSYDYHSMGKPVKKAIELLKSVGISGRSILVYTLYNWTDDPQEFFERLKDILSWGAVCYPMRYQPLNTKTKDTYISANWDKRRLEAVQRARRVIGSGGAFLPHEGMLDVKVRNCSTFDEAFKEFMVPLEITK